MDRDDVVDLVYTGIARAVGALNGLLSLTVNGVLRSYAVAVALGAVILLFLVLLA